MVVVTHGTQVLRDIRGTAAHHFHRQVRRRDEQVKPEAHQGGGDCGKECVNNRATENATCVFLDAKRRQRGHECKGDSRYGHELEKARVHRCDEVQEVHEPLALHEAEDGAENQGGYPNDDLFLVERFYFTCSHDKSFDELELNIWKDR